MNAIDRKDVKIRRMVSSDITSTLNICWTNILKRKC